MLKSRAGGPLKPGFGLSGAVPLPHGHRRDFGVIENLSICHSGRPGLASGPRIFPDADELQIPRFARDDNSEGGQGIMRPSISCGETA